MELPSDAATRLAEPKSKVVRDEIQEFHTCIDLLGSAEQVRMPAALYELGVTHATRSDDDLERDLDEIREAQRGDMRSTTLHRPSLALVC